MNPIQRNTENTYSPPKIGNAQINLLGRLSNACAVSGDEGQIRKIILEQIEAHADEIKIDALGNLLVTCLGSTNGKKEAGKRLRVMLAAHMDEVGMMLTYDEGDGVYRFETVGGMDERVLAGKAVLVGKECLPGVIGVKPVHLAEKDEQERALTVDNLRIDVGPTSGRVKVGDRATFATRFARLGSSLLGKAMDDRLGVATLIELVKHAPANIDLLAAFTVQEEVGLRGARVAAYAFDPDLAIALDSTPAFDLPLDDGEENTRYNTRLGGGAAIYIADGATISDPRLIRHLVSTAEKFGIPYQFRQPGGGGTDAGAIHKQRSGIPSVSISIPGRYAHTPATIVRLVDWRNTLALVHAALMDITPSILKTA
jgi:putative aminopeptidase FrvX